MEMSNNQRVQQRSQNYEARPWPAESRTTLVQLTMTLGTLLIGTVLFAGYFYGICGGFICYTQALFTLFQSTRSHKKGGLCCATPRWFVLWQLILSIVSTCLVFLCGGIQLYLNNVTEGGQTCVIRMNGNSTLYQSVDNTSTYSHCEYAKSGFFKVYADSAGCTDACMCAHPQGPYDYCAHTCIDDLVSFPIAFSLP